MAVVGTGVFMATFNGRKGPGAIAMPGLKAGDRVFFSTIKESGGETFDPPNSSFEGVISADDELKQFSGRDMTGLSCVIMVFRGGPAT